MYRTSRTNRQSAFTLVELLIVIAIIVILLSFVIGGFFGIKGVIIQHNTTGVLRTTQSAADEWMRVEGYKSLMTWDSRYWGTWREHKRTPESVNGKRRPRQAHMEFGGPPPKHLDYQIGGMAGSWNGGGRQYNGSLWQNEGGATFYRAAKKRRYLHRFLEDLEGNVAHMTDFPNNKHFWVMRSPTDSGRNQMLLDGWGNPIKLVAWSTHNVSIFPLSQKTYFVSAGRDGYWGDATPTDEAWGSGSGTEETAFDPGTGHAYYWEKRPRPDLEMPASPANMDNMMNKWDISYESDNLYSYDVKNSGTN